MERSNGDDKNSEFRAGGWWLTQDFNATEECKSQVPPSSWSFLNLILVANINTMASVRRENKY